MIYLNEEEINKIEMAEKMHQEGFCTCLKCGEFVEEKGKVICQNCIQSSLEYKIPLIIKTFLFLIGISIFYSFFYYFTTK